MKQGVLVSTTTVESLSRVEPEPAAPRLDELFSQHLHFIWRVLSRHGIAAADVEDAAQEVFLTAHRRLSDFDPARASPRTWLYAIAVRVAANHRRRAARPPGELAMKQRTDPGTTLDRARALERLRTALSTMDADRREVFVLYEMEELPMKQVAEMLGCPLQTAYTRLHAARREVAAALGEGHRP
jgi:RNA polymerase sigma-70 factor (ECF subfamily)